MFFLHNLLVNLPTDYVLNLPKICLALDGYTGFPAVAFENPFLPSANSKQCALVVGENSFPSRMPQILRQTSKIARLSC